MGKRESTPGRLSCSQSGEDTSGRRYLERRAKNPGKVDRKKKKRSWKKEKKEQTKDE